MKERLKKKVLFHLLEHQQNILITIETLKPKLKSKSDPYKEQREQLERKFQDLSFAIKQLGGKPKRMAKKIEFACDFCSKKVLSQDFPYDKDWKYLYSLKWKSSMDNRLKFGDKHFCSFECMLKYLDRYFESTLGKKTKV